MQDLTKGPIPGHLLKTTSFMLVTMVAQTLYFLVDLFWVGRLGKEAVAGVGVAGNVMFIVLAVTQMLAVGTTALVSHAAGQKDHDRALLVFNQGLSLSAVAGVVFLAVAYVVRPAYANGLSADATTASLAMSYLGWFIPAMALQFPMVTMASALRGTGNFKPGMIVQTATVILNMILAPFLIFGWGTGRPLGVAGAAIASLIAVTVGTLWFSTYFRESSAYLRFVPADWKPKFDLWGRLLQIGLPSGAEFALMGAYLFLVYALTRPFGSAAQAGFGIGMRVLQAGFMPMVALGIAVAPVAGQNFGAREGHRVRQTFRTAATWAVFGMLAFAVICEIFPAPLISFFSKDPDVVAVGTEYLRIISWNFVASGIVFVASSMFQAMGNTVPSLISSLVRIAAVAIPAVIVSRMPDFKLWWLWVLSVASIFIQMTLSLLLLRREFRLRLDPMTVSVPQPAKPSVVETSNVALVLVLLLGAASVAEAQPEEVRLTVSPGAPSIQSGSITGFGSRTYAFSANAGDSLIVWMSSSSTMLYFNVSKSGSEEALWVGQTQEQSRFRGRLAESGDYRVDVYFVRAEARRNHTATYELTIDRRAARTEATTSSTLRYPLVAEGACPFECCTYRDWKARGDIPLYQERGERGRSAGRLTSATWVKAETGAVITLRPGTARNIRALKVTSGGTAMTIPANTSFTVLRPIGEGYWACWWKGHGFEAELDVPRADGSPATKLVTSPTYEWWARLRLPSGEAAWTVDGEKFANTDRCSNDPEIEAELKARGGSKP